MSATFSTTVRLTAYGLEWLKSKLAKWPQVQVESTLVEIEDEETPQVRFDTRVSLNAPVIPGHKLLARIEHMEEGNIIYRCAGEERPAYRTCKPWCDHCKTSRRRNDTFVLLDEATNREKQVGRNCLAEYVRDESAAAFLLSWADSIDRIVRTCSEAEEGYGSGRVPETYTVAYCLSWALAFGGKWISGSIARETGQPATAGELLGMVNQLAYARRTPGSKWLETSQGKLAVAIEARAKELRDDPTSDVYATLRWIDSLRAKTDTELSDYEHNLIVLARLGYVTAEQWSFACSAFRAWLRAQHIARGEQEKREREAAPVTGAFTGEIGKRMVIEKCACVLVKSLGMSEGFGPFSTEVERFLVKFVTPAGDTLTWFTSDIGSAWESGKEYNIAFTPKKHEEYQKVRQTVVQRVAINVPKVKKAKKEKT